MKIYRLNAGEFRLWRDTETRRELQGRLYTQHGEAQVRAPSGRILGTVRSPERAVRIPATKANQRGAHHATAPGECMCREWQKPVGKEKEHHPICLNRSHWEAQQARSPDAPRARAMLREQGEEQTRGAGEPRAKATVETTAEVLSTEVVNADGTRTVEPEPERTPAPDACVCKDWSGAESGKHHALCQFRAQWEIEHAVQTPKLVELETGTVAREASLEEVEASQKKREEDGVGAIELSDGKLYYVRAE